MSEEVVMGTEAFDCGIKKSLLNAGAKKIDYVDGSKVISINIFKIISTLSIFNSCILQWLKIYFHFKTIVNEDGRVLDDSKQINKNKAMELILGKKFKLPIWEKALKTMWVNEVAKFSVDKEVY